MVGLHVLSDSEQGGIAKVLARAGRLRGVEPRNLPPLEALLREYLGLRELGEAAPARGELRAYLAGLAKAARAMASAVEALPGPVREAIEALARQGVRVEEATLPSGGILYSRLSFNELGDDWSTRAAVLEGLLAAVGRGARGRPQLAARRRLVEGLADWWRKARHEEPDCIWQRGKGYHGKFLDFAAFALAQFSPDPDSNPASLGKFIQRVLATK